MRIIVCYKIVPEDQDIAVNKDHTLALDKAEAKISQYDLNAVEAGVALAQTIEDSSVTALSVGNKKYLENSKLRKDALSRGPDSLALVIDDAFEHLLPQSTARILALAAQKTGFDLIICGEGSGDLYAQQVGTLLGEYLDVPNINSVNKITVAEGGIVVERTLENEVEVLEIPLPAVISVTTDINVPKIPTMKAILGAGKKPVAVLSPSDVGCRDITPAARNVSVLAPEQIDRQRNIIEGDSDDNVTQFIENIRKALN